MRKRRKRRLKGKGHDAYLVANKIVDTLKPFGPATRGAILAGAVLLLKARRIDAAISVVLDGEEADDRQA